MKYTFFASVIFLSFFMNYKSYGQSGFTSTTSCQPQNPGIIDYIPHGLNLDNNPNRYLLPEKFIPNIGDDFKEIVVNFIIIQKSGLLGMAENFEEIDADTIYLESLIARINFVLENMVSPTIPMYPQTCVCGTDCYIIDTKLRLKKGKFDFVVDTGRHGINLNDSANNAKKQYLLDNYLINKENELNIVFVGDNGIHQGGRAETPSYDDLDRIHYMFVQNYYYKYNSEFAHNIPWAKNLNAHNIVHELGHAFDLYHPYYNTDDSGNAVYKFSETLDVLEPDYLADLFGLNQTGCNQITSLPHEDLDHNYYHNLMGGSSPSNSEITPMQNGRMHRSTMLSSARNYITVNSGFKGEHIVSQNETWNFDIRMYSDIVVKSGAILTITGKVNMPPERRIYVEKGGMLEINGGEVTSFRDSYLWEGIFVEGDPSKSQLNSANQGKVVLTNAKISNALSGISCGNNLMRNAGGGIIEATNSIFINNKNHVSMVRYSNFIPGQPTKILDNISYFSGCSFKQDAALNDGSNPDPMIVLWDVRGVKIEGCKFINDFDPTIYMNGIFSLDAGYEVKSMNPASGSPLPSTFENLARGVVATGSVEYNPMLIRDAEFEDCEIGIVVDEVDDVILKENSFDATNITGAYGILLENATGYTVEDNFIEGVTTGIMVENSGGDENKLNNNTVDATQQRIISVGDNYSDAKGYESKGLKFLCNDLEILQPGENPTSTSDDIYIHSGTGASIIQSGGKDLDEEILPAGNLFNTDPTFNNYMSYSNNPNTAVSYYHSPTNTIEEPVTMHDVINIPTSIENSCVSELIIESDRILTNGDLVVFKNGFFTFQQDYLNALVVYLTELDGGDPQGLITTIEGSFSSQEVQLKNDMINNSPLSHGTIGSLIQQNVLSNALLYQVLLHNADAARSNEVLDMLMNKPTPMPEYMIIALVEEAQDPQFVDELLLKITYADQERKRNYKNVINHYQVLIDTTDSDSLSVWIDKLKGEFYGRSKSIGHYLSQGNITEVNTQLLDWGNEIYSAQEFNDERIDVSDFTEDYRDNFFVNGEKIWPNNASYFTDLANLVTQDNQHVSPKAENILRFKNLDEYPMPSVPVNKRGHQESLFEKYRKKGETTYVNEKSNYHSSLLFPNPTNGKMRLQLEHFEGEILEYKIYNANGKVIQEGNIAENNQEITLSDVSNGMYIFELLNSDELLEKIVFYLEK